ncbi:hypothetical protein JZ751_008069 [Albula glossodonta]|uniref:Oxysterol-binding protein n=1 Tax=Albula glossodonta TaxID=121402 RepID=A0A8T2P1F1_9TELE|nr:hypothetical protein JZ751_008069 [Albula glossodonta]
MSGLDKAPVGWHKPSHSRSSSTASSRHSRQMEMCAGGDSLQDMALPGICEGYLMKKRKWPLNGWHKRYFVLDKGILKYAKTQHDISKGKLHGSLDVSLAVMSINKKSKRIDLDAGDNLYHMMAKSYDLFYIWVTKLSAHRMYKKSEAVHMHNGFLQALSHGGNVLPSVANLMQRNGGVPDSSYAYYESSASTLNEAAPPVAELPTASRGVNSKKLQSLDGSQPFNNGELQRIISMQNLTLEKPKKKSNKMWGHSRTLSRVEALGMLSSNHLSASHLGASVPSIPDYVYSQISPPNATSPEGKKITQDICAVRSSSRHSSRRAPSVADSSAEYFDASDNILCETSSEASDESGLSGDTTSNSEPEEGHATATLKYRASISSSPNMPSAVPTDTGRRTTLPAPGPDNSHIGLMTILYNNIGKDLSRVSMPIPLNEPVSLLQRLCEELEYSDLLDTASRTEDPYQRMVYIAAFAISGYATARFRNRYKPFNPILGETFECVREDRGFRYISEQVCHHPPISACHADSENFSFWQDQRWKNKFWGKSLEIMPTGMVNVTLPKFNDHYEWNKVVTCIHNVLSQQRYLEHYGEVIIRNLKSTVCTCKITFVKSRYWGSDSNMNEVQGTVLDQAGNVVHRFGGLWHEGIFYPQPKDHFTYYGFSSFAMEMNELTPELKPLLPPTDTRLRPDQRMLEEGRVDEADKLKDDIENKQRDRRKAMSKKGEEHIPRFFRKTLDAAGREVWLSNGTYWKIRENPGFMHTENLDLW